MVTIPTAKSIVTDTDAIIKRFNNLNYCHTHRYDPDMVTADTRTTEMGVTTTTIMEGTTTATHITTTMAMKTVNITNKNTVGRM